MQMFFLIFCVLQVHLFSMTMWHNVISRRSIGHVQSVWQGPAFCFLATDRSDRGDRWAIAEGGGLPQGEEEDRPVQSSCQERARDQLSESVLH